MLTEKDIISMASLYSGNIASIRNLGGFHNLVYEVSGDRTCILRIAQGKLDTETNSEIGFLRYLHMNGAPIAPPVVSLQNRYVHLVAINDQCYTVSAYQKAIGKDCWSRGLDGEERFIVIGRALGKIHRLSMTYSPHPAAKRRQWDQNPHLTKAAHVLGQYNADLAEVFRRWMASMRAFPRSKKSFGLIHGDFLFSNYFFDDSNSITVFDFDECEYSWYIYDIAVCMYYYLLGGDPKQLGEKAEEAEAMLFHLLSGYTVECELDGECLKNMNLFFQLRDWVLLSSVLETSADSLAGWKKDFVEGAEDRLLTGKPFMDIDFQGVYEKIAQAR